MLSALRADPQGPKLTLKWIKIERSQALQEPAPEKPTLGPEWTWKRAEFDRVDEKSTKCPLSLELRQGASGAFVGRWELGSHLGHSLLHSGTVHFPTDPLTPLQLGHTNLISLIFLGNCI